jgi:hypothetical protein
MINTEQSGPDLGLTIGNADVKIFDLGVPFFLPSHIILFS